MSPLSWGLRHIVLFWIGALAFSGLLWALGGITRPEHWRVFWLVPYPNSIREVWQILREAFGARPLEATALIAIPSVAIGVTVVWLSAWLLRRLV